MMQIGPGINSIALLTSLFRHFRFSKKVIVMGHGTRDKDQGQWPGTRDMGPGHGTRDMGPGTGTRDIGPGTGTRDHPQTRQICLWFHVPGPMAMTFSKRLVFEETSFHFWAHVVHIFKNTCPYIWFFLYLHIYGAKRLHIWSEAREWSDSRRGRPGEPRWFSWGATPPNLSRGFGGFRYDFYDQLSVKYYLWQLNETRFAMYNHFEIILSAHFQWNVPQSL